MTFNWKGRSVLVTGGASFIGSQLVDRLVELGAAVVVVVEPAGALPDVDALLDLSRDWIPLYSSFDNCTLKP